MERLEILHGTRRYCSSTYFQALKERVFQRESWSPEQVGLHTSASPIEGEPPLLFVLAASQRVFVQDIAQIFSYHPPTLADSTVVRSKGSHLEGPVFRAQPSPLADANASAPLSYAVAVSRLRMRLIDVGLVGRYTLYSYRRAAIVETRRALGIDDARLFAAHDPHTNTIFIYDHDSVADIAIVAHRLGEPPRDRVKIQRMTRPARRSRYVPRAGEPTLRDALQAELEFRALQEPEVTATRTSLDRMYRSTDVLTNQPQLKGDHTSSDLHERYIRRLCVYGQEHEVRVRGIQSHPYDLLRHLLRRRRSAPEVYEQIVEQLSDLADLPTSHIHNANALPDDLAGIEQYSPPFRVVIRRLLDNAGQINDKEEDDENEEQGEHDGDRPVDG